MTRGLEVVTRGFEVVTHGFELVTRGFELVTRRFSLEEYQSPYRLDVSNRKDGSLVYVNAPIPTRQLNYEIKYKDFRIIPYEINLRKEKWLMVSVYRGKVKHELRVKIHQLRVKIHELED